MPVRFKIMRLTIFLLILLVAPVSWASPLSEAKAAGLVKETPDGYVASQGSASEKIQVLVKDVNELRRAAYIKIADKNGISIEQVASASYLRRHKQ